MINPNLDGISHINIYSKGKTIFGRILSNFYPYKFKKESEFFGSVEAYWYWLGINCESDKKSKLCLCSGFYAKNLGRELEEKYGKIFDPDFEHKILSAIWIKVKNHKNILINIPELPLEHYYNFGGKIYDVKKNYPWMMDGIEKMLNYIKNNKENIYGQST